MFLFLYSCIMTNLEISPDLFTIKIIFLSDVRQDVLRKSELTEDLIL